MEGSCGFMAANLYARSIFGEDALANVSIEKLQDQAGVTGHVRIRAKSQVNTSNSLTVFMPQLNINFNGVLSTKLGFSRSTIFPQL